MKRDSNSLTAVKIKNLTKPGRYADGGNLYLQVAENGAKSWVFRFMRNGRSREMGLGPLHTIGLAEARELARRARQMLLEGIDPIEQRARVREAERTEKAKLVTFEQAAERYIKAHAPGWRSEKHGAQWEATLRNYAYEAIGHLSVAEITTDHVLSVIELHWADKTETMNRVRGRIEAILDWAKARGLRSGENPARWRGHIDMLLPARSKVAKVRHHPAMPYAELPAFMAELRAAESLSAKLLEFIVLTAARTSEATGAKWSEFDLDGKLWTVPGARMKAGREHRVPLSSRVIDILKALPRIEGTTFVFPGAKKGAAVSNMTALEYLRGARGNDLTVHGYRSTFRVWAAEQTSFPREIAEAALAHVIADKTEAAYQRSDALEKRRKLMEAWAGYCSRVDEGAKVVPMKAAS